MIQVEELTKFYGTLCAVEALTFRIEAGKVVGLLGPNGAGKTTTLRLLTGYMPPSAGTIRIGGYDLMTEARAAKRLIGYLPEHPPLYPELSVREFLNFVAQLHEVPRSKRRAYVDEALERTGLQTVQRRLIGTLSRGYQQRTGLAQVLVHQPQILVLDEPTVGLDPKQIAEIRQLIQELAGAYTVLLSSHILQEVSAVCERVIIIHQGKIVAQDKQQNLLQQQSKEARYRIRLAGPSLEDARSALAAVPGVRDVAILEATPPICVRVVVQRDDHFREDLFELLKARNWVPYELSPEHSSLEDVFLELTQEGVA